MTNEHLKSVEYIWQNPNITEYDTDNDYCTVVIRDARRINEVPEELFGLPTKIFLDNKWTFREGRERICLRTNKLSLWKKISRVFINAFG